MAFEMLDWLGCHEMVQVSIMRIDELIVKSYSVYIIRKLYCQSSSVLMKSYLQTMTSLVNSTRQKLGDYKDFINEDLFQSLSTAESNDLYTCEPMGHAMDGSDSPRRKNKKTLRIEDIIDAFRPSTSNLS